MVSKRRRRWNAVALWLVCNLTIRRTRHYCCGVQAAFVATNRHNIMVATTICHHRGGGGGSGGSLSEDDDDDKEELDAYIENLISSVDDKAEDDLSDNAESSSFLKDEAEALTEEEEKDAESFVDSKEENTSSTGEETSEEETEEESEEEVSVEVGNVDNNSDDDDDDKEAASTEAASTEAAAAATNDAEQLDESEEPSTTTTGKGSDDETSKEETPPERKSSDDVMDDDERKPSVPRRRPPNAFYRFLLNQGRVGHILVMVLVIVSEWIALYIPSLANFLAWIFSILFPFHDEHPRMMPRPLQPVDVRGPGQRTGQSGRQKRALTRQADQVALRQLQSIGNVREAKYRHVSVDFMKRHGLGPYAAAAEPSSDATTVQQNAMIKELAVASSSSKDHEEEEDEFESEDVDWVVQALTEEKPKSKRRSLVRPTVAIGVGSAKGPTLSVGFEIGGDGSSSSSRSHRRQSVVEAVTLDARKRKKKPPTTAGPRLSDRDGGDGIFGRIRAAAGTDSRLSRSILGAYPGDAVPPGEAASPEGVAALARKYGWGEWSDEEEDDDETLKDAVVAAKTKKVKIRRRKKRRVTDHSQPTASGRRSARSGFGHVDSDTSNAHSSATMMSRQPNRESKRQPQPPLASSAILSSSRSGMPNSAAKQVRMVRPAMEELKERRHQAQLRKKRQEESD